MSEKRKNPLNKIGKIQGGVMVIIIAAILIELTSAIQYWYAKESINRQVETIANIELDVAGHRIREALSGVMIGTECMIWAIEQSLDEPDSLRSFLDELIRCNENILNVSICFKEDYYPSRGKLFEPLVTRKSDGTISYMELDGPDHNYTENSYYKYAMASGKDIWTEPYISKTAGGALIVSYLSVVDDKNGAHIGVMVSDVSLEWLNEIANRKPITPGSTIVMLSKEGNLLIHKKTDDKEPKISNVLTPDPERPKSVAELHRRMMNGENGEMHVFRRDGTKYLTFFKPVKRTDGWSIAVLCPEKEIYNDLRNLQLLVSLLMILGVALMGYIIWRAARSMRSLQTANLEKERIRSELRVASNIQQGMLPNKKNEAIAKIDERSDVSIHGLLLPAKEVGGDLYDYFIRDEKLFFCIGDVSGKGVPASLFMAVTCSLFRTLASHETHPEKIMTRMNESLTAMDEESMFVTFFIGVLDLPSGRFRYCNAGHDAPIVISPSDSSSDEAHVLDVSSNLPLGVMPDFKYESQQTRLDQSATIFLYTDGLTEAMDEGKKMFRIERVLDVASQPLASPAQLVSTMSEAVRRFVGETEQSDDLTMLAIAYQKPDHTVKLHRSITLPNDVKAVPRLSVFTTEVASTLGLEASLSLQLQLAIEEAVVNVMNYAYPSGKSGTVEVEALMTDNTLCFIIRDEGIPFDPTLQAKADTSLSVEERPIGGLGIHLIRQLMDSINYEYSEGKNILTLNKTIPNHE